MDAGAGRARSEPAARPETHSGRRLSEEAEQKVKMERILSKMVYFVKGQLEMRKHGALLNNIFKCT